MRSIKGFTSPIYIKFTYLTDNVLKRGRSDADDDDEEDTGNDWKKKFKSKQAIR